MRDRNHLTVDHAGFQGHRAKIEPCLGRGMNGTTGTDLVDDLRPPDFQGAEAGYADRRKKLRPKTPLEPFYRSGTDSRLSSLHTNYLFVGEQRASNANQDSVPMPGTSLEASPGTRAAPRTRT